MELAKYNTCLLAVGLVSNHMKKFGTIVVKNLLEDNLELFQKYTRNKIERKAAPVPVAKVELDPKALDQLEAVYMSSASEATGSASSDQDDQAPASVYVGYERKAPKHLKLAWIRQYVVLRQSKDNRWFCSYGKGTRGGIALKGDTEEKLLERLTNQKKVSLKKLKNTYFD